jgi:hypothetical protein
MLGVGLLGAGCAHIPTSGPVELRTLGVGSEPTGPYVRPRPPAEDAGPSEIILGFVSACVGSEDDFQVAREYLEESTRADWDPSAGVTLYAASREPGVERVDDQHFALTLQVVGSVDSNGVRNFLTAPVERDVTLRVVEAEEGWRISDPPPGIFLSDTYIEILYVTARVYFLNRDRSHLVADLRWFPAHKSATAALAALVAGPAPFLDGAVVSSVPASSSLGTGEITRGTSGSVEFELPDVIASLPANQRLQAISQIQATLRSISSFGDVQLMLDGKALSIDATTEVTRALPAHRPIGAGQRGILSLADLSAGDDAAQMVPDLAEDSLRDPVLSSTTALAAALRPDRTGLLIASRDGSTPRRDVALGSGLVPPRIDDHDFVWTSTARSSGAMLALSGRGGDDDAKVMASWLEDRTILGIDLAPDSTRMLVLSSAGTGSSLDLCAVVRDGEGTPISLTEGVPLAVELEDVVVAQWFDEAELLVLGTDADSGSIRMQVVDLQGEDDPLPLPPDGTDRIAGTTVADVIWCSTGEADTPRLFRLDSATWSVVDLPVTDPSFY